MKKTLFILIAIVVAVAFTAPSDVEARRGGFGGGMKSYKSPKQSYTQTPSKSTDNISKSKTGETSTNKSSLLSSTNQTNRGFFSGGGLMRGLFIGGLAGMLFGGLFGSMGFLGDFFGLVINLLAIYVLFIAIRGIFRYFSEQRKRKDKRY